MKPIFALLVFILTVPAFGADTNRAKCRAEVLAQDMSWGSQIRQLAKTGKVYVKSWSFRSDDPAFGPTIYVHMWHTVKNGKVFAQVCARCFHDRIQGDDAAQDGGWFEYVGKAVRCDLDDEFNPRH